jgi:Lrp/AsnC family transcriptional regulator, leucine-responsive regulatory protein
MRGMATTLDPLDRRILERYQHDTQLPAHIIGAAVGLSTAAVQRRLKRLRAQGVIVREVAEIAPKTVGLPVTCIVGVNLERERSADVQRFKRRMAALPEVQQCYYVTGEVDFMLVVLAADMEAYEAFTQRALFDDDNVRSFTTHVVLDRVKTGVGVALAAAGKR